MSDSTYLVGAFLVRKRTDSGGRAVVEDDAVSRVEETTKWSGINPATEILPT